MQLPFAKYLTWLHLTGKPITWIDRCLDELSFPRINVGVHAEYARRASALPLSPMARKRVAKEIYNGDIDLPVFTKLGFKDLYAQYSGQAMDPVVTAVLGNPVMRIAIECCLAAKMGFDDIKALVLQTHKIELTEGALEYYSRVYFDLAPMTKPDWREYLGLCTEDPYLHSRYFAALTQPVDEMLHLVGLPTKPIFSTLLRSILSTAEYKFKRYAGHGTLEGDELAIKWAKAGIVAGVQYEKFSSADATDFSAVLQTEFEFLPDDLPNVTGEMLAGVKPPEAEEQQKAKIHNPPPLVQPELEV